MKRSVSVTGFTAETFIIILIKAKRVIFPAPEHFPCPRKIPSPPSYLPHLTRLDWVSGSAHRVHLQLLDDEWKCSARACRAAITSRPIRLIVLYAEESRRASSLRQTTIDAQELTVYMLVMILYSRSVCAFLPVPDISTASASRVPH